MNILFAFFHHLAAFTLVSALVAELVLLQQDLNQQTAKTLRAIDAVYGVSAGLILLFGALRVMYFEKGASYYLHSGPFMIKLATFAVIGLISIYPTVVFFKWGKLLRQGVLPAMSQQQRSAIVGILYAELLGIGVILLNAVLMAKGVSF